MMEYEHKYDCAPRDLPLNAISDKKTGVLEKRVVSVVPPCRVMHPPQIDLEDSGLFLPLKDFLGMNPNQAVHLVNQREEVAVYEERGPTSSRIADLHPYSW